MIGIDIQLIVFIHSQYLGNYRCSRKNGSRETCKAVVIFCSYLLFPRTVCLSFAVYYNNGKFVFYTKLLSQLAILFYTLNTMVNLGLRILIIRLLYISGLAYPVIYYLSKFGAIHVEWHIRKRIRINGEFSSLVLMQFLTFIYMWRMWKSVVSLRITTTYPVVCNHV